LVGKHAGAARVVDRRCGTEQAGETGPVHSDAGACHTGTGAPGPGLALGGSRE
jgi:hypothetical protein